MAGRGRTKEARAATPRGELTRIRESRERQDAATRRRIIEATLEVCGDRGFRRVAVQDVIDRYGGNRVQFYRYFGSKRDAYDAAFAELGEELSERLLRAGRGPSDWRHGLCAALRELADEVNRHPSRCRGLLLEVHVAGGPSLAKRAEIVDRLTRALDTARSLDDSRQDTPSLAAPFMVGAIDASVTEALAAGEPRRFTAAVPALARMIVAAYLGDEAADDEQLASLQAA